MAEKLYRCPDDRFCNDGTLAATRSQWRAWAADTVPDWLDGDGNQTTTVDDVLAALVPVEDDPDCDDGQ